MPKPYYYPKLDTLALTQVDRQGASQTFYLGSSIGDPD
jgi:hypothetical protein